MADLPTPTQSPLSMFKKLPKWAWVLVAAAVFAMVLYLRHRQAVNAQASDQNAGADQSQVDTADPNSPDNYQYGAAGTDPYINDPYGQLPTDIFGGVTPSNALPGATGTDGTTAPASSQTINIGIPTGGGPPNRPADVHKGHGHHKKTHHTPPTKKPVRTRRRHRRHAPARNHG